MRDFLPILPTLLVAALSAPPSASAPARPAGHAGQRAAAQPLAPDSGRPPGRYDGEYGLWVRLTDRQLIVHWTTRDSTAGRVELVLDGRVRDSVTTTVGRAHVASLRRPRARSLTIRYGAAAAAGSDHHEITIRPGDDARRRPARVSGVDSLYVMGDVHGEYDNLLAVLRNAGLVDQSGSWSGRRAHLVVLGDMLDRGSDATAVLWFLYRLERQAQRAGGRVYVVLGNHEVMVMTNDLRYTTAKERYLAASYGAEYWRLYDPEESVLGRWLASMPAVLEVGDVLLAHGGVAPALANTGLEQIDDSLHAFMHEPLFRRWADSTVAVQPMDSTAFQRRFDAFWDDESVLWYRGYVEQDTLAAGLRRVLEGHDARLHVVAHTPLPTIRQRYGGDIIAVDMLRPATEMLLLVRDGRDYRRFRITAHGPPQPLEGPAPTR